MPSDAGYSDLQIRILDLQARGYPVELTLDGQHEYPRGFLDPSFLPWISTADPQAGGERLFCWLFADEPLKLAWAEVSGLDRQCRLRLRIDAAAPELHVVPWELLRQPASPGRPALQLAADSKTPFSRYLALPSRHGRAILGQRLRVLAAVADPVDLAEYRLTPIDRRQELAILQAATANLGVELVELKGPCTLAALEAALRQGFHVLHLIAHGKYLETGGAVLLLADEHNQAQVVPAEKLASMLGRMVTKDSPLRLVFLASCQTAATSPADAFRGAAQQLVQAGLPAVLAMQDTVSVDTARTFAERFYRQLLAHGTVDLAANQARASVLTADLPGVSTAVLFVRLPNGQLLGQPAQLSPLHLQYLRSWFGKTWATVHLADLLQGHAEEASLLDVYVPLPVSFSITVKTEDHRIVDWWVKRDRQQQQELRRERIQPDLAGLAAESGMDQLAQLPKERAWSELGVNEAAVQQIVDGIQRIILLRRQQGNETKDGEDPWYMEAHDAASVQPRFVLLGDPGSGKSSFLRHLALCLAGELRRRAADAGVPANASLNALRDWLLDAYTPIYVELRDLATHAFAPLPMDEKSEPPPPTVEDFWSYIRTHLLKGLAEFEPELRKLAAGGQAILLLDGLDEVPEAADPRRRQQIKQLVASLTGTYPTLRIVVAGRPHAYRFDQYALNGFGHTTLEPLFFSRLLELAQALFGIVEPAQSQQDAKAFIQALQQAEKARSIERSLFATPMFFTMLAALWLDSPERRLPQSRAALYRASVDLLLDRWTRRHAPNNSVADTLGVDDPKELRAVLECLACTVHEHGQPGQDTTVFHFKELLGVLAEAGYNARILDVAAYLEQHAGLLVSPKPQHFYFSHRGFQEHLAACELLCEQPEQRRPPVADERCFPQGLIERVGKQPALWENVARLAVEDLIGGKRQRDGWQLLAAMCEPYAEAKQQAPETAILALEIAHSLKLFNQEINRRDRRYGDFDLLRQAAKLAVMDTKAFPLPEQRNLVGELLGSRPGLDDRPGVGLRPDGLPDIDWVPVPDRDAATGKSEFIYGDGESQMERTEADFWMAHYPVTYLQFQAFLKDTGSSSGNQAYPYWNHPRENVNWYDAIAFCRWLTAKAQQNPELLPEALRGKQGWSITLPTEWQWEKTARGHDGRQYPWGNKYRSGYANIDETQSGYQVGPHYLGKTSAVGMYPYKEPDDSPYGIADLSGNVWEWCLNEYKQPERYQLEGSEMRVLRGGSWPFGLRDVAAAPFRSLGHPGLRSNLCGFRVVAVLPPP